MLPVQLVLGVSGGKDRCDQQCSLVTWTGNLLAVAEQGASDGDADAEGGGVGVFVFLVPVLLVVVLGYAVGYALWEATGAPGNPEVFGWLTGLALLAAVSWLLLSRRARLRRALRRTRARGNDAESSR